MTEMAITVINTLQLSTTHIISDIRHNNWCHRKYYSIPIYFLFKILFNESWNDLMRSEKDVIILEVTFAQ